MIAVHQFNYIFAIAMIFAFLDAFNIGANDCANSWASSISSKALKYWQGMILAAICELLGACLVGSRVSDTIRKGIFDVHLFDDDPTVLMLTMTCALVGSSVWLTIATSIGMPCSTTHSIVGGVVGAGIAAKGGDAITWGWDGIGQIIASWFIAPLLAGIIASIVFLISKFAVLEIKSFDRSLKNALLLGPVLTFVTFAILTMLIVWKGSPNLGLDDLSEGATAGSIIGVGAVAMIVYLLFFYPYYRRKLVHQDWTLRFYDILQGPLLFFKSTDNIPPMPEGHQLVTDYYEGRRHVDEILANPDRLDEEAKGESSGNSTNGKDDEVNHEVHNVAATSIDKDQSTIMHYITDGCPPGMKTSTFWMSLAKQPSKWFYLICQVLAHGFNRDVISDQVNSTDMLSGDIKAMHMKSKFYDNRIEHFYSFLQAMTAGTMSFAHGANDIANATGPLASVYLIFTTNTTGEKAEVPPWILGYAGVALVIGVWTFGYRIIRVLGNKLILQSPSRGFAIELGSAITVIMATRLAIPVSTTQCATGAIVFVGLCNKDLGSVNWRIVIWCYAGWILTLPIAGLIAGLLNGIILYSPTYGGGPYELGP